MGYWNDQTGGNLLQGVPDDTTNPVRLSDANILFSLQHSCEARIEFNQILPTLSAAEQDRLNTLIADNPLTSQLLLDPQEEADIRQRERNRALNVQISGPNGARTGGRRPTFIAPR